MSLTLTNREKQKIKVDIGSIINYNQKNIDYFNTITTIKLKNGHILEVLETEEQIEKMIYQYHDSGEKIMRETWEKQKSEFIELTIMRTDEKILFNKKQIVFIESNVEGVCLYLSNRYSYDVQETYEEIKEMLGLQ